MCCESFKKIVGAVLEIFEKSLKVEHLPKITMVVTVWKNQILGIAIKKVNKTFTATKGRLNTYFGFISKQFRQRNAYISVHLTLSYKQHGFNYICDLFEIKHTEFFLFLVYLMCSTP